MAQVIINDGDSGLVVRTALNAMFTELYALTYQIKDADGDTIFSVEPSADADYGQLTVPAEVGTTAYKINNGTDDVFDVTAKGAITALDSISIKARAAGAIATFKNSSDTTIFRIFNDNRIKFNAGGIIEGSGTDVTNNPNTNTGVNSFIIASDGANITSTGDANVIISSKKNPAGGFVNITGSGEQNFVAVCDLIDVTGSRNFIVGAGNTIGSTEPIFSDSGRIALGYINNGISGITWGRKSRFVFGIYEGSTTSSFVVNSTFQKNTGISGTVASGSPNITGTGFLAGGFKVGQYLSVQGTVKKIVSFTDVQIVMDSTYPGPLTANIYTDLDSVFSVNQLTEEQLYVDKYGDIGVNNNLTIGGDTTFKVYTTNVSNPPTDAELDSAYGTPATVGTGWTAYINDDNAGTNFYRVVSDGTNWWYFTGTKAV